MITPMMIMPVMIIRYPASKPYAFYAGAFGLPAAARFAGFGEPEIHEFKPSRFPGYLHANTLGGQSALTKYRAFSTWVFRLQ